MATERRAQVTWKGDLMNGSGTPVSGAIPSTTKMFSSAWQRMIDVRPAATSFA